MVSYFAGGRRVGRMPAPYQPPYNRRMPLISGGGESVSGMNHHHQADGAGHPPVARKRIAVACGRCRKRKIRCSGDTGNGNPCQNCRNAGAEVCQFLRVASQMTDWKIGGNSPSDFTYNIETARSFHVRQPQVYGPDAAYVSTTGVSSDYLTATPTAPGTSNGSDSGVTVTALTNYGYPSTRPYYTVEGIPALYGGENVVDVSLYQSYAHHSPSQSHGNYVVPMRATAVTTRGTGNVPHGSPYMGQQSNSLGSYAYSSGSGQATTSQRGDGAPELSLGSMPASQPRVLPSPVSCALTSDDAFAATKLTASLTPGGCGGFDYRPYQSFASPHSHLGLQLAGPDCYSVTGSRRGSSDSAGVPCCSAALSTAMANHNQGAPFHLTSRSSRSNSSSTGSLSNRASSGSPTTTSTGYATYSLPSYHDFTVAGGLVVNAAAPGAASDGGHSMASVSQESIV